MPDAVLAELHRLKFASDATMAAIWAAGFACLALAALLADRRRTKRKHIDAVGCMPWTGIFFACLLVTAALALLAIKGWVSAS